MLNRAGKGGAFSEAINEMDDVGAVITGVDGNAVVSASKISDGAPERETFLIRFGTRLGGGLR